VLKFVPGYAGSNITAKKIDSKANREYLQQLIKSDQLPTLQDALAQMEAAFHIWNNKPFNGTKSPLQKYQESFEGTKDRQRFVTEMNIIDAFWEMPGKIQQVKGIDENGKTKMVSRFIPREYTFTSAGITIERDGKEYQFDVENAEFRAYNIGKKFNVKYDYSKMDRLFLIDNDKPVTDKDGNIIIAKEKTVLHMAVVDRVEGEGKEAHRLNALREEQKKLIQDNHKQVIEQTQLDGTFTPVTLGNLYPKETENAIKASRMESLLGDTTLSEKKKKPKDMPQIFDALEPVVIPQQLDQSGEATPKIDRWS
jgi:transposase